MTNMEMGKFHYKSMLCYDRWWTFISALALTSHTHSLRMSCGRARERRKNTHFEICVGQRETLVKLFELVVKTLK